MEGLLVEALKSPEGWYFGQKYPVTYSPGYVRENELRQPSQDLPRSGVLVDALVAEKKENEHEVLTSLFPEVTVLYPGMTKRELTSQLTPSELFVFIGHGESEKLLLQNSRPLSSKDFRPEYLRNLQLAVLAACSTGVPSNKPLDTSSLVSAFQAGGTPRVIASRWDVDSKTTTVLMNSFYEHLKNGKSVSRALLEARKEIFRNPDHRHPYYWAGFVLNGRA
jgi:CHAT domain-containing protein